MMVMARFSPCPPAPKVGTEQHLGHSSLSMPSPLDPRLHS
jgi:hypothetical protein